MCMYSTFTHIQDCVSLYQCMCGSDDLCAPKLSVLNVRMLSGLILSLYGYVAMSEAV